MQALLRAKANTELVDNYGRIALQYAEIKGHTAIAALIRQQVQAVQAATTSPAAPEEPALNALDGDDGARSSQLEPHSCLSCAAACQHPSTACLTRLHRTASFTPPSQIGINAYTIRTTETSSPTSRTRRTRRHHPICRLVCS